MPTKLPVKIVDYYNSQAGKYDSPQNQRFYAGLAERLCRASQELTASPKTIMEIGSGSGFSTAVVVKYFPGATVTAVEPSARLLSGAKHLEKEGVRFINCRLAELNPAEQADMLIGNMSYHWLSDEERSAITAKVIAGGMAAFLFPTLRLGSGAAFKKYYSGNRLLLSAFRAVMDRRTIKRIPKRWRGLDLDSFNIPELDIIYKDGFDIVEELDAGRFLETLASRGPALALFGEKANTALAWIESKLPESGKVQISWPVGIALARKAGEKP